MFSKKIGTVGFSLKRGNGLTDHHWNAKIYQSGKYVVLAFKFADEKEAINIANMWSEKR